MSIYRDGEPDDHRYSEFVDIFARHQAGSARSLQRRIGPSEIGHLCDRHLGYKLQQVPPVVAETLKWAALVGTWGHAGAEEAMRAENARLGRDRYLIEHRALVDDPNVPGGHTDVYDTDLEEVIDWKFVGQTSMDKYRRKGPPVHYRVQLQTYALGWSRMGRTVKRVRIVFLPRWSNEANDGFDWSMPYNPSIALDALARIELIRGASTLTTGGLAPWTELAADHTECRFCPWLRRSAAGAPEADGTGCNGYYRRDDLAELGGETAHLADPPTSAASLAYLISRAQHPDSLVGLWRSTHNADACTCPATCGEWTTDLSARAAARRAELGATA